MIFFAKEGAANVVLVVVTVLLKSEILKTSVVLKTLRDQEQGTKSLGVIVMQNLHQSHHSEVSYIDVLGCSNVILYKILS